MPNLIKNPLFLVLILPGFLWGCAEEQTPNAAAAEAHSRQLSPQDKSIAAIYDRSCRSCHTIAATGAPLTGDIDAWSIRLDKGMDTLVNNVVTGFGGMPPFGMCMDCEVPQFEALITFMSGAEGRPGSAND
ncbi:MAG: c-type cytochrome [Halioglobus sp.]